MVVCCIQWVPRKILRDNAPRTIQQVHHEAAAKAMGHFMPGAGGPHAHTGPPFTHSTSHVYHIYYQILSNKLIAGVNLSVFVVVIVPCTSHTN